MPQTTTLFATALAMIDEGVADDDIVAALVTAAGDDPADLADSHAAAVFLADTDPEDGNARRVSKLLARAVHLSVERRWSSGRL